jgi:RimJ/RimL family protein N-acetyltransferase
VAAFESSIGTERLVLRHFRDTDLDDVHRMQSDADVVRFLYWTVRTLDESRAWLQERIAADRLAADDDGVALAVERREDTRVIGSVNVWLRSLEHRQGEIGFVFARDVQGQGYAYEATSALLDVVFPMLNLHRVYGSADARNEASLGLMRRLGMRQEAHFRENELFKGEWGDDVIFAILRPEWEASR